MSTYRSRTGITQGEYDRLLEAQGGVCAICGNPPKTRRLDVDHDHKTGTVRGLLCHRCNRALPSWVTAAWLRTATVYIGTHGTGSDYWDVSDLPEVEGGFV